MTWREACRLPDKDGPDSLCGKPARDGICSDHRVMLAAERLCEELARLGINAHPEWRDGRYTARLVIENPSKLIPLIGNASADH